MKVLRFFGWLFIPYIMLFFRWKHIKVFSRVLFIMWSFLLLSGIFGANKQQDPQPVTAAATVKQQPVNKPVQDKTSSKPTTAAVPTAAAPKPVPKQPVQNQTSSPKAKLDAEIQAAKNGSYQDKMKALKDYINTDKKELLADHPKVQDMGFAGELYIEIPKNGVQKLNSVGDQVISQQANGVYWEVPITLSNASASAMEVNTDMFTLVTTDGRKFTTDIKAEMMLSKPIITDTINPGVEDTGYLIFDVPADLSISSVTLNVQYGLFHNVKLTLS